jgi:hypothetical protein
MISKAKLPSDSESFFLNSNVNWQLLHLPFKKLFNSDLVKSITWPFGLAELLMKKSCCEWIYPEYKQDKNKSNLSGMFNKC